MQRFKTVWSVVSRHNYVGTLDEKQLPLFQAPRSEVQTLSSKMFTHA